MFSLGKKARYMTVKIGIKITAAMRDAVTDNAFGRLKRNRVDLLFEATLIGSRLKQSYFPVQNRHWIYNTVNGLK